jgi:hypothetical protein
MDDVCRYYIVEGVISFMCWPSLVGLGNQDGNFFMYVSAGSGDEE